MRVEEKKEQIAKDNIVEMYTQQIKQDHDMEIREMNLYIAELKQGKGIINAQPNKQQQEALVSLRSENTDLKRKIAETS